jgi:adenylate cyclase
VNSGRALVGNIGSETRLNYTAIGDTVNIASRLEGANKIYGTSIIIGEGTRRAAGDVILARELDSIAVYGRSEGIAIYELLGVAADEPLPLWVHAYHQALADYRGRRFRRAIEGFREVVALRGRDVAAALMIERCRTFLRDGPPAGWAGTTALGMK